MSLGTCAFLYVNHVPAGRSPNSDSPKGSMQKYGIYVGPIAFPMYLLWGPSIYHIATWTLWARLTPQIWVAVKELKSSYYIGETLLFTTYTHYGNLI